MAWLVIVGLSGLMIFAQSLSGPVPGTRPGGGRLQKALFEFQARYLVGAAEFAGGQGTEQIEQQLQNWQAETDWQRLRLAVLEGELVGPEAALKRLHRIQEQGEGGEKSESAENRQMAATLAALYEGYAEDESADESLSGEQRERLRNDLGWFGNLALAPPGDQSGRREEVLQTAQRAVALSVGGLLAFGLLGLIGVFVLIVVLAMVLMGKLDRSRWKPGFGGVYAETFAVWLLLFLAFSILGDVFFPRDAIATVSLLALLGSLLAVLWPCWRGVPWRRVRQDIGWTGGRGAARESLAGAACYAMALPLISLGLILAAVLAGLLGGDGAAQTGGAPIHPAAELLVEGGWAERIQWLLLACVVAPLVEETMFRGVLYRHIRESTASMHQGAGALVSALIVSFVFAVIHPQGLLGVPVIMGLALAFALMREWRGTLVPPILAHATNNTVMLVVLLALV